MDLTYGDKKSIYFPFSLLKRIEKRIDLINSNKYLQSTGLFLFFLLGIKLLAMLGTLFIYAKITPFNDAAYYLKGETLSSDIFVIFSRTLFTNYVFSALKFLFHYDILVHLFVSVTLSLILWFVFKLEYKYINKALVCLCLCLPHFLIWTSIVGKEAIAIGAFLLIIRTCIDLIVWNKFRPILLSIGLFLALIERPHYAIAYLYLFIASLIFAKSKIKSTFFSSTKKSFVFFSGFCFLCLIIVALLEPLYSDQLLHFMMNVQYYFSGVPDAHTTRTNIPWSQSRDFFTNIIWGVPVSIIGPTLFEALNRIVLLPVFIEGCMAVALLTINFYSLIRICQTNPKYNSIIIWGFLPAFIIGLLINYPFGIFNVGSAIRYKQSLAPLFYFSPVLLLGAIKKKNGS
jgi:hypothetical protein